MISARQATLRELSTVYGVADLYRLVEIIRVDTFNQRLANKWASREET